MPFSGLSLQLQPGSNLTERRRSAKGVIALKRRDEGARPGEQDAEHEKTREQDAMADDVWWTHGVHASDLLVFGEAFRMDCLKIVNSGQNAVSHRDIAILPGLGVHP